ncbi:MAG TPA: hypothetical protein VFJ85_05250 [Acidimicrobiales bacterium]|nr:hypothetical protein [Acidimicrobiales bacterium]
MIKAHAARGDELASRGDFSGALHAYNDGWRLLPDPKEDWDAATWLLGSIADVSFQAGWYTNARRALDFVMYCPNAIGNPFLHLRRGQVLFEQGEYDGAADELIRAYMGGGPEIFESDDPKYLAFLRTRAILP